MASYTPNYNLKKPAGTDVVDIDDLNGNMDIVDTQLNSLNSNLSNCVKPIASVDGTVTPVTLNTNTQPYVVPYDAWGIFYLYIASSYTMILNMNAASIYAIADGKTATFALPLKAGSELSYWKNGGTHIAEVSIIKIIP